MSAKQQIFEHITVNVRKDVKKAIKKKIADYDGVLIKDCVEAGLILVLEKDEKGIKNILKKYESRGES